MLYTKNITKYNASKNAPKSSFKDPLSMKQLKVLSPNMIVRKNHEFAGKITSDVEYLAKVKPYRPISPHLTIYSFPLPAITSITHRITGVMLSGTFFLLWAFCVRILVNLYLTAIGLEETKTLCL
jgi:hypothetical protein